MADFLCQRKASVLCSNLSVNSLGKISLGLTEGPGHWLACSLLFNNFLARAENKFIPHQSKKGLLCSNLSVTCMR